MELKTLLVTGAAGSLGSALSEAAAARGITVLLLDRDRTQLFNCLGHGSPPCEQWNDQAWLKYYQPRILEKNAL